MTSKELYLRILFTILIIQSVYVHKKYVVPTLKNNGTYEGYKWYLRIGLTVVVLIVVYMVYILFLAR